MPKSPDPRTIGPDGSRKPLRPGTRPAFPGKTPRPGIGKVPKPGRITDGGGIIAKPYKPKPGGPSIQKGPYKPKPGKPKIKLMPYKPKKKTTKKVYY
jgi:hypothetical protein